MADKETIILEIQYKDGEIVSRKVRENTDELKKEEKATEDVQAGFDKMKLTGVAALAAIGAALKQSYDKFVLQENATIQLEGSLRALGRYTPQVSGEFHNLASSLQRTSRYGDEELLPMFSKLITLGDVQFNQLERVTRAAMDFAVVTGSLDSAVDLLAKASVGYTASLSRYGIIIDESIPQNERFEYTLRLIENRMGGLETRMTGATEGGVKQMWGAIGDLMELGFRPFAPLVDISSEALKGLAYYLADAANEASRLKENLPNETLKKAFAMQIAASGAGIYGITAGYSPTSKERMEMERNRPPLVGGSPLSSTQKPELTLVLDDETQALIKAQQINRGIAAPGRPSIAEPEIALPPAQRPSLDMSGQDPMKLADEYVDRLFFFQNELEKMFGTADRGLSQTTQLALSSSEAIGSAFSTAFAGMASGATSAGDAITSAILGSLGQIAIMWGQFHVAQGAAMLFVPGMQGNAAGEIAQGLVLLSLGGTVAGLAGRGGRSQGGGAGYSSGSYSRSASGSSGGAGGGVNVFIVSADGRVSFGGKDVAKAGRAAGIEGTQMRTLLAQLQHLDRTGSPPWKR